MYMLISVMLGKGSQYLMREEKKEKHSLKSRGLPDTLTYITWKNILRATRKIKQTEPYVSTSVTLCSLKKVIGI